MNDSDLIRRTDVQQILQDLAAPALIAEQALTTWALLSQETSHKEHAIRLWQIQSRQVAELEAQIRMYGGELVHKLPERDLRHASEEHWSELALECQVHLGRLYQEALRRHLPVDIRHLLQGHQTRRAEILAHLRMIKGETQTLLSA